MEKLQSTWIHQKELWILVPIMLFFFGLSTPFNFSWPQEVKYRKNIIDVTEAVSRMEKGNTNRRVGLVLLGIYGVVTLARTRNRFCINGALGWLTTVYMAWILLSLTWSIDTMFTLRRVTTLYLLSIGAAATAVRYSIREIAVLTLYVCGITAVIALCNEIRLDTLDPPNAFWRFSGIFHTVAMGWNCGLLALSSFYLASISKTRRSRWLLHLTLTAAILLLILTKSRMALISTVAALLFFWMMASSRHNKAGIVLGFISLSCIVYLLIGDHIFQYLESATTLGRGEYATESIGTLTGRLPLWQECFRWSAMKPFLGYGFNTFISPIHYASIALNVGWTPSSIHSGYLDAIMGLGYTGFVMLVSILGLALIKAIMLAKRFLSYSFVAALLIWLCYNLFLEANLITRPTFMTFIILTILVHLAFLPEERLVPELNDFF